MLEIEKYPSPPPGDKRFDIIQGRLHFVRNVNGNRLFYRFCDMTPEELAEAAAVAQCVWEDRVYTLVKTKDRKECREQQVAWNHIRLDAENEAKVRDPRM